MDDLGDYRPGLDAVKELGVLSPLRHVGLTKDAEALGPALQGAKAEVYASELQVQGHTLERL